MPYYYTRGREATETNLAGAYDDLMKAINLIGDAKYALRHTLDPSGIADIHAETLSMLIDGLNRAAYNIRDWASDYEYPTEEAKIIFGEGKE